MGRYRKSIEEKKLSGTLDKRTLTAPETVNPFTSISEVDIPADLSPVQQQIYYQTVSGLIQYRAINNLDLETCRQYAVQCALAREAEEHLRRDGAVVKSTNVKGYERLEKSPWVEILNSSSTLANRLSACLGLNPLHRTKLNYSLPKKTNRLGQLMEANKRNPFADVMGEDDPDYDPMEGLIPDID